MCEERDAWLGRTLSGRYLLRRKFESGGMSRAYEGWDQKARRRVAVKLIEHERDGDETVKRLQIEALALRCVRHRNVVGLLDWQVADGHEFFVMEYAEGFSLEDLLIRQTRFRTEESVMIVARLLEALEAVHAAGLLHRDVKPGHMILMPGDLKLIDFGLVIPLSAGWPNARWQRLTRSEHCMGTPAYMSPERIHRRDDVDVRADLYSAGLILYEMLSARLPFAERGTPTRPVERRTGSLGRMVRRLAIPPSPIGRWRPDLPILLQLQIMRALEPKAANRFQSAAEMRTALLAVLP